MSANKINIPLNPANNKPKGFAFVEFKSKNSALKTVKELNDKVFKGRKIQASMAIDQRLYQNGQEKEQTDNHKEENGEQDNGIELEEEDNDQKNDEGIEEEEEEEPKPVVKNHKSNTDKDKGIVFVKNVNYDINGDDFTEHFKAFDKIVWAKVI